jgi:hypothetical protein
MAHLLAIDLGLRAGLAVYDGQGRLVRYSARSFGTRTRLRRAAYAVLAGIEDLERVVLEGDRGLGEIWERAARRWGVEVVYVPAESWREKLLYPREQRSGADAKRFAEAMARRIIRWSGVPAPTTLRCDAAEAIVIGLWGVLESGWLATVPQQVLRR